MDSASYKCTCDPQLAEDDKYRYARMVVLELPHWSVERNRRLKNQLPPTVSIDSCIAEEIKKLWDKGIETMGCCCGHNSERGWVQVYPDDYPQMFELGYEQRPAVVKTHETGVRQVFGLYAFYL